MVSLRSPRVFQMPPEWSQMSPRCLSECCPSNSGHIRAQHTAGAKCCNAHSFHVPSLLQHGRKAGETHPPHRCFMHSSRLCKEFFCIWELKPTGMDYPQGNRSTGLLQVAGEGLCLPSIPTPCFHIAGTRNSSPPLVL